MSRDNPYFMKGRRNYLLEAEWVYDHGNVQFMTFTVEDTGDIQQDEASRLIHIFDQNRLSSILKDATKEIARQLCDAQPTGMSCSRCEPKMLYEIVNPEILSKLMGWMEIKNEVKLGLTLLPICSFDSEGNPQPIK